MQANLDAVRGETDFHRSIVMLEELGFDCEKSDISEWEDDTEESTLCTHEDKGMVFRISR